MRKKKGSEIFFDQYATRFNSSLQGDLDIDGIVNAFAESFIEASPSGIHTGKNDLTFRDAIPRGLAFYKNMGIHSMTILSNDITLLDDFHSMAKIRWKSMFLTKGKGAGEIQFHVIYLLQLRPEGIKIFAYITGDEQQALKNIGLIEG